MCRRCCRGRVPRRRRFFTRQCCCRRGVFTSQVTLHSLSPAASLPYSCASACPPTRGTARRRRTIRATITSSTCSKGRTRMQPPNYHHRRTHTRCSSKGAISPAAASAAALQLPGASRETASAAAASVQLLPLVFRVFSILNPEDFHTFSAAKCVHRCARQAPNELKRMRQVLLRPLHCAARRPPVRRDAPPVYFCNILRMYADVLCDDGSVVQCSRTLAVVYYCSSVWDASWGGALVDLESSDCSSDAAADAARSAAASTGLQLPLKAKLFPPKFNRLVVFSVPRFHQVTPVAPQPATAAPRLRLSVFGWFLQPGRRYPLMTGDSSSRGGGGGRVTKKNAAGDAAAVHAAPRKRKLRGAADPE